MAVPRIKERPNHGPDDGALIVGEPARVIGQGERLAFHRRLASQLANYRCLHSERIGHLLDRGVGCSTATYQSVHSGVGHACACCERPIPELNASPIKQGPPTLRR